MVVTTDDGATELLDARLDETGSTTVVVATASLLDEATEARVACAGELVAAALEAAGVDGEARTVVDWLLVAADDEVCEAGAILDERLDAADALAGL